MSRKPTSPSALSDMNDWIMSTPTSQFDEEKEEDKYQTPSTKFFKSIKDKYKDQVYIQPSIYKVVNEIKGKNLMKDPLYNRKNAIPDESNEIVEQNLSGSEHDSQT